MKKLSKKECMSEKRSYMLSSNSTGTIMMAQLIGIEFFPGMSEETLAFNATLILQEGSILSTFYCSNDGHGGSTNIYPQLNGPNTSIIDQYKESLRKWDEYLSAQRDDKFYEVAQQLGWNSTNTDIMVTKSAESEVNELLAEWCDKHNL